MLRLVFAVFVTALCASCDNILYSPNVVDPSEKNLNAINIDKIAKLTPKTDFDFILMGDTQRFYDELEEFVGHANGLTDVEFILVDGDLVDFGLNREYNWIAEKFARLNKPYVAVIGNHDMLANGRRIYNEMFGAEEFTFWYGGNKFICLNTNSREVEYDGSLPNMPFLKKELADTSARNIFVLSHVPPFSGDFDSTLQKPFADALAAQPRVRLSMHGHDHSYSFGYPYKDGVPYVVASYTKDRSYARVKVRGTTVSVTEEFY